MTDLSWGLTPFTSGTYTMPIAIVAIGGNSLVRAGEAGTIAEQAANARRITDGLVRLIRDGFGLVLTHGNGPQVGAALLRSERAVRETYSLPLDVCGAATQGEIGYLLQQVLGERLARAGLGRPVVTVVSQVVVGKDDPAFSRPTKPIGPFYSPREAEARRVRLGWTVVEDAARGWRRVVPSPSPLAVVEEPAIRALVAAGAVVIACGGGGIPVVREDGWYRGVDAVIDKDAASALLAIRLDADLLVISTDVDRVYLNYATPRQAPLARATVSELHAHARDGHFPAGSMGPKVQAAMAFVARTGRRAVITSPECLHAAVAGRAGTQVVPDGTGEASVIASCG